MNLLTCFHAYRYTHRRRWLHAYTHTYIHEYIHTSQEGSVHDCYFNTIDHTLSFYTAMSGHHSVRLLSYLVLVSTCSIHSFVCAAMSGHHSVRLVSYLVLVSKCSVHSYVCAAMSGHHSISIRFLSYLEVINICCLPKSYTTKELVQSNRAAMSGHQHHNRVVFD